MRQLRDFLCNKCGDVQERYIDDETVEYPCECGGTKERLMSSPVIQLEGLSGDFPGAYNKWANMREQKAKIRRMREGDQ